MSVAKNAAKDLAGGVEQAAGAVLNKDDLEEKGHEKRVEAAEAEKEEEAEEGGGHTDVVEEKVENQGVPDYSKSTTIPVGDLNPGSD